jgi:hypothetical protein
MSAINIKSRREFFLQGSAALSAGVAATAGASVLKGSASADGNVLHRQLAELQDREAIRQLQLSFAALVEKQNYEAAADLFADEAQLDLSGVSASGKSAIQLLFSEQYRQQRAAVLHSAYRANALQQADALAISDDRQHATAMYHVDVALCSPVQGECTAAQMARLQGNAASQHWEAGRFIAKYVKTRGQWKMASLNFLSA